MIQFNLLPDIKLEYIRTKRVKHLVLVGSILVAAAATGLLIIMFSLTAVQKKHVSDLNKDIQSLKTELEGTPDLNKILTIQNQLNTLNTKYNEDGTVAVPGLYDTRPAITRLPGYLQQTTPVEVKLSKLNIDFSLSSLEIGGTAPTLELVNKYIDTLKFTKFTVEVNDEKVTKNAFNGVVLSAFGRDQKEATFTINFTFDPAIFDSTQNVKLEVPATITTRSQLELPGALFNEETSGEQ